MRKIGINVLALALFWLAAFALGQARQQLTDHWLGSSVTVVIAAALGVAIAWRLRAFVAAVILGGQLAFALSELGIQLVYGTHAMRGAPVHFAVMIAGTLGVVFGMLLMRARASRQPLATTP